MIQYVVLDTGSRPGWYGQYESQWTCRLASLLKVIHMPFEKLAIYFDGVRHRAKLLKYYSLHPFVRVWTEISDHSCLSLGKAMKLTVAIMMGLLISLLQDDTRLRIWSKQIKPCTQRLP